MLALSIKKTQKINNVSLVTSDDVPEQYVSLFDKITKVPGTMTDSFYKTEHRWKAFVTPYEETVVPDTDMIFLNDVSLLVEIFSKNDIGFLTDIRDYRNKKIDVNLTEKHLKQIAYPMCIVLFYYFKKTDPALKYYEKLKLVCENYKRFYKVYVQAYVQNKSMDVNHAICLLDSWYRRLHSLSPPI